MLTGNDMRLFIEDEPSTSDVEVLERIKHQLELGGTLLTP
jgi:hypothetical protein